jgi:hypothetical protein
MQFIFNIAALFVMYLVIKHATTSGKIVSGCLSFLWLWMGIVYHLIYFTAINKAAYLFGILFILQGILFLIFGVFQSKLVFKIHGNVYGMTGIALMLFALLVYPLTGYFFGHYYPYTPTFGLPCPTTIFTFGLLLLSDKKCPAALFIIPFLWSLIGFTAALKFGMVEDTALLVSALACLLMLVVKNRKYKRGNNNNEKQLTFT